MKITKKDCESKQGKLFHKLWELFNEKNKNREYGRKRYQNMYEKKQRLKLKEYQNNYPEVKKSIT